ncbi:uncharacterized protein ACLA_016690 [Aspergillus clavatus NRRL 1]|uniref:Altered inheritance of mitochondria protein 9, mitochondrial n=1 Tax=Aspergillus clavatus (strain ATCC 1007 / CBS 513.65 / DSM 816 / NCTC 3887 / NRRL 1 / QM 1276 / 107) TaxID=344612 RepID=A1CBV5_ASPCL|nr:uncharacterized protein ACLA_016690 [Aspergillus clavatus NRRL 1]EAW13223.1 conserved hypothetical protein [Aspergillus clavatus NRRL 1]
MYKHITRLPNYLYSVEVSEVPRFRETPLTTVGKSITREEVFAYTNGRFLVDEQRQIERRFLKFNLDALCDVAAAAGGGTSRIRSIEKFEGGFSKVLLMKMESGNEVIAKVPCRIAGPATLTTASEVGALSYVRTHTSIPVPRVLSWSSDESNPVGAEYIIMEKAAGVPLFEQWGAMAEIDKLELIKNLTKLEAQLSAISFPAYGGLYLQEDAVGLKRQDLDEIIDPDTSFCVGPSPDRSFGDATTHPSPQSPRFDQGPWNTLSDLGVSIAERELSRISEKHPKTRTVFYQGTLSEQVQLLETTKILMRMLDSHPILARASQPTLWHTDLHMGNIFVSPDDNSQIVSLIDFQSLLVLPLFLQAQWPVFLRPPLDYPQGLVQPKLPSDFEQFDEEAKSAALQEWTQTKLAKAYEVSTFLENRVAHKAMNVPRVFRELFIRCGEVSEVGIVPLRECLIEIFQSWSSLGFAGQCPYSFRDDEIDVHGRQFAEYQAWNDVQQLVQECLDTDAEGWVAPQLDFAEKQRQNKELLSVYIKQMAEERSAEEAKAMWPFPDT